MGQPITRTVFRLKTRLTSLLLLGAAIALTGCKSSSSSSSDPTSASTALTLTASSQTVNFGGTVAITVTGGSGTYTSGVATVGTVLQSSNGYFTYTAPSTGTAQTITITVVDSAGTVGSIPIYLGGSGSGGGILTLNPLNPTIAISGTQMFSVSGGSGSYTWTLSGGGSLSSTTGMSVTYLAPSYATTATITVTDITNSTITSTTTIMVSASGGITANCNGTWNANVGGVSATMSLVENSSGQIGGSLSFPGVSGSTVYALSGSCTTSTINFTLVGDGSVFTGTFYYQVGGTSTMIYGSYNGSAGGTYNWSATH